MSTGSVVEFLRARLDEDEGKAREAIAMREATPLLDPEANTRPDYALVPWEDVGVPAMLIGPERVLREVEAKRRIVDLNWHHLGDEDYGWGMEEAKRQILAIMALPYADHPDYDPEWR